LIVYEKKVFLVSETIMKISAYILAKNEEDVIAHSVTSLTWCNEVIVADTGSKDRTKEIAKSVGAKVISLDFQGFGKTRNEILKRIEADWIVCFDADEICTEALAKEIRDNIKKGNYSAFVAPRMNFFMGKKIFHSGWYPDFRHPVAFKKECCQYAEDIVHEKLMVKGETGKLKEPFAHFSYRSIDQMLEKGRKYTRLSAEKIERKRKKITPLKAVTHATFSFIRHYFLRLGFLDGIEGLIIAVTAANSVFFKYVSVIEKQKSLIQDDFHVPYSLK